MPSTRKEAIDVSDALREPGAWDKVIEEAGLNSPAIQRIIEEVRVGGEDKPGGGYNRTYHRHNR